ncbi:MAG: 16S rRNA (cytosine(1402)-N(4))-methyltransferase RsmH [Candidatus Nealsonbacteria bacterium]
MHTPVLQKEVIAYLNPSPNQNFVDGTIGNGGHALSILERVKPRGKVLGIDLSEKMLKQISKKENLILVCGNYANLKEIVKQNNLNKVQGVLLDLGMSSWHLDSSQLGFSFKGKEKLDMRYSQKNQLTAEKIVNFWSRFELERIFKEYGEEMFAKNIAEKIIEERKRKPIITTAELVEVIRKAVPKRYLRDRLHFATRVFQALRIAVNDELNNLTKFLPQAKDLVESGGRIVVISFHSLEDRIVKNFFKSDSFQVLTKKPVMAELTEVKQNPRSRSAKLRAATKI